MEIDLNKFELTESVPTTVVNMTYTYTSEEGDVFHLKGAVRFNFNDINTIINHFNNVVPILKTNSGAKSSKLLPSFLVIMIARWLAGALGIPHDSYTTSYFRLFRYGVSTKLKIPVKNIPMTIGEGSISTTGFKNEIELEEVLKQFQEALAIFNEILDKLNPILSKIKTDYENIQK